MVLLEDVLNAKNIILSVTGPYAGESERDIYARKKYEINKVGYTFWHHQSNIGNPADVQEFCSAVDHGLPIFFILISSSSGGGGGDTKKSDQAKFYSTKAVGSKKRIPEDIYVEAGGRPYALVIKNLELAQGQIDLWKYSRLNGEPIKTSRGASTLCAIKEPSEGMKSRFRNVVAFAEIVKPYSIWLK